MSAPVVARERVAVPCEGGEMGAYLTLPAAGRGRGIVLLQEIFGVNGAIRAKCDRLAAEGFTVLAPDLFWRLEPNVDLGYSEEERQQGFGFFCRFDQAAGVRDIAAAWQYLRNHAACDGNPAIVGFCLGGRMAVRAGAALPDVAAVISFYGVGLDELEAELMSIDAPLRLYFGDQDSHVPLAVAEGLSARLAERPNAGVHIYPGAGHGFYNPVREAVFHAESARLAHDDMVGMLRIVVA